MAPGVKRVWWAVAIGAVGGIGWIASAGLATDLLCTPDPGALTGLDCIGHLFTLTAISAIVWTLLAGGALKWAEVAQPLLVACLGPVLGLVLLFVTRPVLGQLLGQVLDGALVFAISGACGYALAGVVGAGYGGRRDRAEHRGQDG